MDRIIIHGARIGGGELSICGSAYWYQISILLRRGWGPKVEQTNVNASSSVTAIKALLLTIPL